MKTKFGLRTQSSVMGVERSSWTMRCVHLRVESQLRSPVNLLVCVLVATRRMHWTTSLAKNPQEGRPQAGLFARSSESH